MTAEEFNNQHKKGQPVWLILDSGEQVATYLRSEAWELGHGDAVAKIEGKSGGWDVDRIRSRCE